MQRTAEYDAFGPWILPVTGVDEVPPVFRGHPFDFGSGSTILKIPRDIARRDASPEMHLYDWMVIADEAELTTLERVDDTFSTRVITTESIAVVDNSIELLDGRLSVQSVDGTRIDVPYNSSSRTAIEQLIDRLVARVRDSASDTAGGSEFLTIDAMGDHDIALANYYNSAARRRELHPVALRQGSVARSNEAALQRMFKRRPRLSGTVVAAGRAEAVVISRRDWVRSSPKPDFSTRETILVGKRLSSVQTTASTSLVEVVDVEICLGSAATRCTMPADSAVVEALTHLR